VALGNGGKALRPALGLCGIQCGQQAEPQGHGGFRLLQHPRILAQHRAGGRDGAGHMVHRHGLQPGSKTGFQVHQPRAAWAAQPFAAGGRQRIALQRLDIHGDMAQCLGRVHDVGNAVAGAELAQGNGVIHRAAVGGNPCEGDQLDARIHRGLQRRHVQCTAGRARHSSTTQPVRACNWRSMA
jgi:hypothetical protein